MDELMATGRYSGEELEAMANQAVIIKIVVPGSDSSLFKFGKYNAEGGNLDKLPKNTLEHEVVTQHLASGEVEVLNMPQTKRGVATKD